MIALLGGATRCFLANFFIMLFFVLNVSYGATTAPRAYPFAVILTGADLSPLTGLSVAGMCAYRYVSLAAKWEKVRVQIDEKNPRGEFVLEKGMPYTANSDDGLIDSNDEVLVRPEDFGDPFNNEHVLKLRTGQGFLGKIFSLRLSMENSDQTGLQSRLLALGVCTDGLNVTALVDFDAKQGKVNTSQYEYTFLKKQAALLGNVALNGTKEVLKKTDLFAGSKFVMNFELPWYAPDFSLTDDNFKSEIECWRIGPIRTIVAVGVKLRGLLSFLNLHMFSELVFYENGLEIPTNIEFVFDPTSYFKSGTGIAYGIAFGKDLKWSFASNLPKLAPLSFEELGLSKLHSAARYDEFWARVQVEDQLANVTVTIDESAKKKTYAPMYFLREDQSSPSLRRFWKWLPDFDVDLGVFLDMSKVEKGEYNFNLDLKIADESESAFFEKVSRPKVLVEVFGDYAKPPASLSD